MEDRPASPESAAPGPDGAPLWRARLRWRMRGAWMWPAWFGLTLADGLLLYALPFSGDGSGLIAALLAAGFANLFVIAILAPLAGRLLRRRRPDLPRMIATDYAGTGLLATLALALVVGGVVHRPLVVRCHDEFVDQAAAARHYVLTQAPARFRRNLDRATTLKIEDNLYRTCVPSGDPGHSLCLAINTDQSPPGIRRERSEETNATFAGPVNAYRAQCG